MHRSSTFRLSYPYAMPLIVLASMGFAITNPKSKREPLNPMPQSGNLYYSRLDHSNSKRAPQQRCQEKRKTKMNAYNSILPTKLSSASPSKTINRPRRDRMPGFHCPLQYRRKQLGIGVIAVPFADKSIFHRSVIDI